MIDRADIIQISWLISVEHRPPVVTRDTRTDFRHDRHTGRIKLIFPVLVLTNYEVSRPSQVVMPPSKELCIGGPA